MAPNLGRRSVLQNILLAIGVGISTDTDFITNNNMKNYKMNAENGGDTTTTVNHGYIIPEAETKQEEAYSENFSRLDTDVAVRDQAARRNKYEPKVGAKFLATDTEAAFLGNGEEWVPMASRGKTPNFDVVAADKINGIHFVDPSDGYDELVTALDTLGDTPGTVFISQGTISDIDGNVTVPDNTWLRGAGMFATTLQLEDGASMDLAGLLRIEGENVVVSDLALDGNRENVSLGSTNKGQEYGLYTSGARNILAQRVYCHDFPGYGFDPHADNNVPSRYITITDCIAENNGFDGFTIAGVEHATITNNFSVANSRHGFNATDSEGIGSTFANNVAVDNEQSGIVIQNGYGNTTIQGNLIEENEAAGIRLGTSGSVSKSITVANNVIRENGSYGINIRLAHNISITGNQLLHNGTGSNNTAELVIKGDGTEQSRQVLVTSNQLQCQPDTDHGVDERDGSGPSLIATNIIRGYEQTAITSNNENSVTGLNLTD